MNVGLHLSKRAELDPRQQALVDDSAGLRFTYAELNEQADRAGHVLTGLGLSKPDRVALLLPNCHQFVEVFYGAARAGLVVVPLNWRLVADELEFMLRDSGATVLVFDGARMRSSRTSVDARLPTTAAHRSRTGCAWAPIVRSGRSTSTRSSHRRRPTPLSMFTVGDDPLFIMYTSGTTALPKGAVHTHDSIEWAVLTILASVDVRIRDRFAISLPLFHVGALTPMACCVYRGAAMIMLRQFDAERIWDVFRDEPVTTTLAVPAMLNFMLATYRPEAHQPLQLRWILSGAAPVPPSLIEAYASLGLEIHQVYGLTESGGPACVIGPDDAMSHIGSTGKGFFHTDVRIVDEHGVESRPGDAGEDTGARAAHHGRLLERPEATAETIVDGWLHTGDMAVQRRRGLRLHPGQDQGS